MMGINTKRSFTEITTTTPTSDFSVGFNFYENLDHINVLVDNVSAVGNGYTVVLSNPTTIHITPAVATGKVVRMERETNIDDTKFKFTAGAEFDADHVDQNFEQILHSQQEVRDSFQQLADRTYPLVAGIETALERAETQANAASASADAAQEAADAASEASVAASDAAALASAAQASAITSGYKSVKAFGAIGDGTLHPVSEWTVVGSVPYYPNLAAIQVDYPHVTALTDSIDWAAAQKALSTTNIAYYPKSTGAYINNRTLQMAGNWDAVIGASKQVVIKNVGVGLTALRLTKAYQTVRNIAIWGNGGLNGTGATTSHGIHLDNGTSTNFHDVSIRYHGGHGIYGSNGVWITKVNQCYIEHNLQDGINLVSPSGGTFDQIGNALSITDSSIAANGGNGVKWKAVALSISGSVLEANKGYGLLVTTNGYTASAFGISFVGNYTENNILGELKFESTASAIVTDVNISGNYFYSIQTGGAIAAITFVGTYRSTRSVNIRSNSLAQGGTVLNLVDGGNSFREDCTIDAGAYSVVNMTQCQLIQGNKTKSISGAFLSKGVTWSVPSGSSANFFSASATDIYFPIDLQQAQALLDIKFYITANMTSTYSMTARIMSKDSTVGDAPTTEYVTTLSSGGSGGNNLFTMTPVKSNQPIRIAVGRSYYLHLTVNAPSTGTSIQIHDPILRYV